MVKIKNIPSSRDIINNIFFFNLYFLKSLMFLNLLIAFLLSFSFSILLHIENSYGVKSNISDSLNIVSKYPHVIECFLLLVLHNSKWFY